MAAIERHEHHRVRATAAVAVVATLVAITLAGCSSGSKPAAHLATSATSAPSTTAPAPPATGPRVIIDTDFSLWWDDATALGLANVLEQQGAANVLGIMSDVRNPKAVAAIDAFDTAYGHGSIPLGAVSDSNADTARHGYTDVLASQLPHTVQSSNDVPNAVVLYRQLLARQPDHSVTIVSLGGYTNLAGLIATSAGRALVNSKVTRLVIEDGLFPGGVGPATNQKIDPAATRAVVAGTPTAAPWPTPIAWVDGLDGLGTRVGGTVCAKDAADTPIRIIYNDLFHCGPVRDGDWDGPTLLFALGDMPQVFSVLGRGGSAVINKQGGLSWQTPSARHDDVYVHVKNQQALNQRIDQLITTA
ncbi:MAG TPA: nucleoside hydrolase [Acidimicrobiia bacterium]|jgi:hypothetical protein